MMHDAPFVSNVMANVLFCFFLAVTEHKLITKTKFEQKMVVFIYLGQSIIIIINYFLFNFTVKKNKNQ